MDQKRLCGGSKKKICKYRNFYILALTSTIALDMGISKLFALKPKIVREDL